MSILSPETRIFQYAESAGQLEEYLKKAEDLLKRWQLIEITLDTPSNEKYQPNPQQFFHDEGEYHIAALLLFDNLLPKLARQNFAQSTILAREELRGNFHSANLMMRPIKKGRKKNHNRQYMYNQIDYLIANHYSRNHAFLMVTKAHDISSQNFATSDHEAFKLAEYFKNNNSKSDYPYIEINTLRAEYQKYSKNRLK
jgi:hypothetical protein